MKRVLAMLISVALVATLAVGGSIAYLTDTDSAVNVMEVGNVDIEQIELQRAEGVKHTGTAKNGDLVTFEPGQKLYPAVPMHDAATDYTAEPADLFYWGEYVTAEGAGNGLWNDDKLKGALDKFVFVENMGKSDAYYRTILAFECPEGMEYSEGTNKEFMMNINGSPLFIWDEIGYADISGSRYLLMVATYNKVLEPGEISRPSLLQVVMTHNADNDDMLLLGDTYEILAFTQAVQADNMTEAYDMLSYTDKEKYSNSAAKYALDKAFGKITTTAHPWLDGIYTLATTDGELLAAIKDENVKTIRVQGNLTYDWGGDSYANSKALLMKGKAFFGADKNASLTFAGYGSANPIKGVTLKDITIKDETVGDNEGAWEHGHLEFEGLSADNVIFENSIMLAGTNSLTDCTVNNNVENWYGAWVNSGNTTFKDCTFTGTRAIKIHEAYGTEVASVTVNNCSFDLTEKPGVVIGDVNAATSVSITKSYFNCLGGDQGKYIYESDTDINTFHFKESENEVVKKHSAADADSLIAALEKGEDVVLTDDIEKVADTTAPYGNKVGFVQNGGVFDGNNQTLSVKCYGDDYGIMTSGGTIKNLTIDEGCRAIMIMSPTEDIILDNVRACGKILYPINTGEHATVEDVDLIVTDSSFGGWSSFAGIDSASFTNCAFVEGKYGYGWPYETLVKPYINTTLKNCTFADKYYLDLSSLVVGCKVTLDNCTVNGTKITADICGFNCDGTETFCVELPSGRTLEDCVIFK